MEEGGSCWWKEKEMRVSKTFLCLGRKESVRKEGVCCEE